MKSYFNNFGDIAALANSEIQKMPKSSIYLHIQLNRRPTRDITMVLSLRVDVSQ